MVSPGKEIRLSRIFNRKSGRAVIITMDHAIAHGVLPGIKYIGETIEKVVAGGPNAITIHKGLVRRFYKVFAGNVGLIVKTSSFAPYHPSYDVYLTSIEEAIRLGADAVAIGAAVGDSRQADMLRNISALAEESEYYGIPLAVHIYPKGDLLKKEDYYKVENIAYAARVAAELGADIVKTWYTGSVDTFEEVVKSCPAPVVIAGGPKVDSVRQFLEMVRGAIDAGAAGVAIGRNVWGYKNPTLMVKALNLLVHENLTVDEVMRELKLEE